MTIPDANEAEPMSAGLSKLEPWTREEHKKLRDEDCLPRLEQGWIKLTRRG